MTTRPLARAVLALLGTGVLAGAAVYLGFVAGTDVAGGGGEIGGVVGAIGLVVCVVLLAWGWSPLASRPLVAAAAVATGLIAVPTTVAAIALAVKPYEAIVCDEAESFCGLGVLFVVPTIGAVVPWTVAGLPGLTVLVLWRRRQDRVAPGNA